MTTKYAKEDVLKSNLYSYYNTTASLKKAYAETLKLYEKRDEEIDDTNKEIARRTKEMEDQEIKDEESRKANQERIKTEGVQYFIEAEGFFKERQGKLAE